MGAQPPIASDTSSRSKVKLATVSPSLLVSFLRLAGAGDKAYWDKKTPNNVIEHYSKRPQRFCHLVTRPGELVLASHGTTGVAYGKLPAADMFTERLPDLPIDYRTLLGAASDCHDEETVALEYKPMDTMTGFSLHVLGKRIKKSADCALPASKFNQPFPGSMVTSMQKYIKESVCLYKTALMEALEAIGGLHYGGYVDIYAEPTELTLTTEKGSATVKDNAIQLNMKTSTPLNALYGYVQAWPFDALNLSASTTGNTVYLKHDACAVILL